jgi:uncharacterized membrane protein YdbT with pleckstrin-like domain
VFRASPRWLAYRMLLYWIGATVAAAALALACVATLAAGRPFATMVVVLVALVVAAALLVGWFCVRIEYDLRTYIVTDRSMRVREGAWVLKEMTLTYANVQNVQVLQGPVQRLFRIEDLRVDTAGGGGGLKGERAGASGHQVTLAGLENAHEVRDLILAYVKRFTSGSGLGDLDDPEHAPRPTWGASAEVLDALRGLRGSAAGMRRAAELRA